MIGFLFSWFIGQRGPTIGCSKTQTLPNLRLPISSGYVGIYKILLVIFPEIFWAKLQAVLNENVGENNAGLPWTHSRGGPRREVTWIAGEEFRRRMNDERWEAKSYGPGDKEPIFPLELFYTSIPHWSQKKMCTNRFKVPSEHVLSDLQCIKITVKSSKFQIQIPLQAL